MLTPKPKLGNHRGICAHKSGLVGLRLETQPPG